MKLRPASYTQILCVQMALRRLREARDDLKAANCPAATEAVRHALKSTEGALRHASRRAAATPEAHYPQEKRPQCSVCNDRYEECSHNYSGGWVGTPCPKHY